MIVVVGEPHSAMAYAHCIASTCADIVEPSPYPWKHCEKADNCHCPGSFRYAVVANLQRLCRAKISVSGELRREVIRNRKVIGNTCDSVYGGYYDYHGRIIGTVLDLAAAAYGLRTVHGKSVVFIVECIPFSLRRVLNALKILEDADVTVIHVPCTLREVEEHAKIGSKFINVEGRELSADEALRIAAELLG